MSENEVILSLAISAVFKIIKYESWFFIVYSNNLKECVCHLLSRRHKLPLGTYDPFYLLQENTMKLLVKLLAGALAMSSLSAQAGGDWGKYKVKIRVTNAEKWKVKWMCFANDGSVHKIDADQYPASTSTTRETNITQDKCDSGDWKIEFEMKVAGKWKSIHPDSNYCKSSGKTCGYYTGDLIKGYVRYVKPKEFNSSNKLCLSAFNFTFGKMYLGKTGC